MPTYDSIISRTDAAALIPEEVASKVLQGTVRESAALSLFPRTTMSRKQQRLPVLSALPTAYFVDGDTGLKQTTEQAWANKYLNAEELACIVPIPETVLDDSEFDAWGSIQPRMEEAIGRAIDAAVFFGTNKPASWPTDVVTAALAAGNGVERTTNAAAAGGIVGDFSDLFATVETDGYDVDGVIAHRLYKGFLRQARATTGESLIEPDDNQVTSTSVYGVTLQYPMRGLWPAQSIDDAAEAIAFSGSEFMLAVRQDLTYKVLDQAVIQDGAGAIVYNLAQQDMVALRVVMRVAWQVANIINYDQPTEGDRYPAAVMYKGSS